MPPANQLPAMDSLSAPTSLQSPAAAAPTHSVLTDRHADDGYLDAILGVVVGTAVLVLLVFAVIMIRYVFRHKGSYRTNEARGTEFAETADVALQGDPALQDAEDDSKKEYFL